MMKVQEAWSPEDSRLIFRGNAAISTVSAAIDTVFQDPTLCENELATLVSLSNTIDYQLSSGETRGLSLEIKNNHLESELVHRGLRSLVRRPVGIETPTITDHFRAWKASRLIGKIARATV